MILIMPATTSGRFVGCFMGRTFLVGLENNIPNSFLNGIVFLFWCISGLKERIMSHICDDPLCVACELRFLFRMFDQGLATQKEVSTGASSHHHFTSHHHIITSSLHITSSPHHFTRLTYNRASSSTPPTSTACSHTAPTPSPSAFWTPPTRFPLCTAHSLTSLTDAPSASFTTR